MCECEVLKNVPIGQKRKMIIEHKEDFLGIKVSKTYIVVDNYGDKLDIFLNHTDVLYDGMNYGTVFDITHCPFCGRDLRNINA